MDMSELKRLLEEQGRAWEEFKRTNDELIKAKADGKAVAEIEAKLAKLNEALDKYADIKADLDKLTLRVNRKGLFGDDKEDQDLAGETKQFNLHRRAFAKNAQSIADLDVEQYAAYKSAFFAFARKGNVDLLSDGERKALTAGVDSEGGYLLPASTVGRILARMFETSPIRQLASVVTISSQALEGVNDIDEASCGWVAETAARPETNTPALGKYRIEAFELYAMPKASQVMLDDAAVDVEGWLANKIADKFTRTENNAYVVGNGVGKPRGFTAYPTAATGDGSRAWGTLEHVNTGANGTFAASGPADCLFDLIGAFKPWYLQNATWLTRREAITAVRKLKEATTNAYMWQPGLQAGQPDRLLGYPILIDQDMPALATGSLSMALGDFREGYTIVDRIGIRTLRDPYTAKPYVLFYSTKRTGGGVLNFEAIKFIRFSA